MIATYYHISHKQFCLIFMMKLIWVKVSFSERLRRLTRQAEKIGSRSLLQCELKRNEEETVDLLLGKFVE